MKKKNLILFCLGLIFLVSACKETQYRWQYSSAENTREKQQELEGVSIIKAHLRNGEVLLFPGDWSVDTLYKAVIGYAHHFDHNRTLIESRDFTLPIDSVVLFELNGEIEAISGNSLLAPLAIVNTALSIFCITNPKACFGSCPTFYLEQDEGLFSSRAEGFSNAICPSLEYGDVDDLKAVNVKDSVFSLLMKNEAYETHLLRSIELWAVPKKSDESIYQSRDGDFYSCQNLVKPLNSELLSEADYQEYFSAADANNLASKEELILDFGLQEALQDKALVLDFRQSLMTTYFIYSAMAYMGDEVADIFAKMERLGDLYETMDKGLKSELGELEVYLWNELKKDWEFQGAFYETGPIAINRQILDLADLNNAYVKVKLRMNRGLWRIDRAALTTIKAKVEPELFKPQSLIKNGSRSKADLVKLNGEESQLISFPGDVFQFNFELNPDNEYALFLYAKGYYWEWMRDEWKGEKNLLKLRQMFKNPARYLRREAAAYKEYEKSMEDVFWSSQVPAKSVSTQP